MCKECVCDEEETNLMSYDHIMYSLNQDPLRIKEDTGQMGHQISRSKIGLSPANWDI